MPPGVAHTIGVTIVTVVGKDVIFKDKGGKFLWLQGLRYISYRSNIVKRKAERFIDKKLWQDGSDRF